MADKIAEKPVKADAQATPSGGQRPSATVRYVDRPNCPETFADSITGVLFDGQTLRIEFAVTWPDEVKPNTPITGRRHPACRLILTPTAAVELINRMQQIGAAIAQAGLLTPNQKAGEAKGGEAEKAG